MADTKISAETDAATLDGTEVVPVVQGGANRKATLLRLWRGLWGRVMSAVPTAASTGLSTWLNQGTATVADNAVGITITDATSGTSVASRARYKVAPATPYTITALVSLTVNPNPASNAPSAGIAFTDGTKLQLLSLSYNNVTKAWNVAVNNLTNSTTYTSTSATSADGVCGPRCWLRLEDDGTNAKFYFSQDGVNFYQLYSVAKASGFLGGAGYSNVGFYVNPQAGASAGNVYATLESWA